MAAPPPGGERRNRGHLVLKLIQGFSSPLLPTLVLAAYAIAFLLLSRVEETIPLGITDALWSGIGIGLIAAGALIVNLLSHPGA